MKHAAMTFVLTLGLLACGAAAVEESPQPEGASSAEDRPKTRAEEVAVSSDQPLVASTDQPVRLAVGESVTLSDSPWVLGFEGVESDSRCPRDVQCVWQGDAVVKLWLQEGSGERQDFELHTTQEPKEIQHGDLRVRLEQLEPYPESTSTIAADAYLATVRVSR